jgi:hypothetical protein
MSEQNCHQAGGRVLVPLRVIVLAVVRGLCLCCAFVVTLLNPVPANAQGRAIEDLRVSRIGNIATAEVVLACQAGVLDSSALDAGGELRIRLTLHPACTSELGRQPREEIYRPPSGDLARIREMSFESNERGEAFVTIRFDALTSVSVSQSVRRDSILLQIDTGNIVADLSEPDDVIPVIEPPPLPDSDVGPGPGSFLEERRAASVSAGEDAEPIRLVGPGPAGGIERYVVQLAAADNVSAAEFYDGAFADNLYVYVNERAAGNRRWQELRAGFFSDESGARTFLQQVSDRYPQAVIVVADELEQRYAGAQPERSEGFVFNREQTVERPVLDETALASYEERFTDARRALMTGDNVSAIEALSELAFLEGFARREQSLEMLGVAHERSGNVVEARSAYNSYIASRPDGPDSMRVRQRLAGLVTTVDAVPTGVAGERGSTGADDGRWDVRGGISQYYRDDRYSVFADESAEVTQSALLSHIDLSVRRDGERFDFVSRVNGVYVYDLLDDNADTDDQALVSRAYFGIADKEKDWGIRLGRQTLYRSGVLGRFDGITGNFRYKPDVVLNFTAGSPVDSPHSELSDRRQFFGVSADLEQFIGKWDISVFSLMQQVDGIADREAIGGEAQYRGDRWHVLTALDLDMSYGVANSALVAANWQATEKLTFNTRVDLHAAPFLVTRNAIIGQGVKTVEDMLGIYSESQIRRIARDRTAQATSASLGFSWALFDRFQMNSDVTYTEFDATEASAGVDAFPASDPQLFFSMNFIGSSLFRDGDTAIFEFRHSQTRSAESAGIVLDFRLPMGPRLRFNPRVAVTSRRYWVDWSTEWFIEPTIRFLMRVKQQHRFEAEIGGLWSNRGFRSIGGIPGLADQETAARFINFGYWWEF